MPGRHREIGIAVVLAVVTLVTGATVAEAGDGPPAAYMIQVEGRPAASVAAIASDSGADDGVAAARARRQLGSNEILQDEVMGEVDARGLADDEIFRVGSAFNGVAVTASPADVRKIETIDGVRSVQPIPIAHADNSNSVPFISAPDAWASAGGGLTGQGMRIGIIDTGIDYVHKDFGGAGTAGDLDVARSPGANPLTPGLDPAGFTVESGGDQIYPSAKVVGGFDFAGDDYNANTEAGAVPKPDPNPIDCPVQSGGGHGTHVAGTAAGLGVDAAGDTYGGSYDGLDPSGFRIGPGVAPGAELYAMRVFGCDGTTNLVVQAIDWAVDPNRDGDPSDRLDVVNLSLGSSFGMPDTAGAKAVTAATRAGTSVVVSAGNSGNLTYENGSPASSPQAITVANMVSGEYRDAFEITDSDQGTNDGLQPASFSGSYPWDSMPAPVTGEIHYPATNRTGCDAFDGAEAAAMAGKVALLDWRSVRDDPNSSFPCGSKVRTDNAEAAGAIGVVIADSATDWANAIAGNGTIPAVYAISPTGSILRAEAQNHPTTKVTFDGGLANETRDTSLVDTVAGSSSRGPDAGGGLKPDISAPGTDIISAASGSGSSPLRLSGTSMAAPHVTGVMALLRQAHPAWTVEELKALAMNSADPGIFTGAGHTGPKEAPQRVGTGTVDVGEALKTKTLAFASGTDGTVGVSFGALEVPPGQPFTRQATIKVENKSASSEIVTGAYTARTSVPGVSFSFPQGNVLLLEPGESSELALRLSITDPSALRNSRDSTLLSGSGRQWLAEASGLVSLADSGNRTSLVPVHASVRPVSTLGTTEETRRLATPEGTGQIQVDGQFVSTGTGSGDFNSLVTPLELQATSPQLNLPPGSSMILKAADLKNVGVAYDQSADRITFGGTVWGNNPAPSDFVDYGVLVDSDRNGTDDFVVHRGRALVGGVEADTFLTVVERLSDDAVVFTSLVPVTTLAPSAGAFNTDVFSMSVPPASIGLNPSNPRFDYRVETDASGFASGTDKTAKLTYSYMAPGLSFPGTSIRDDRPGPLSFDWNSQNLTANGSLGVLLLHHMNANGSRDEAVLMEPEQAPALAVDSPSSVDEGSPVALTATATDGNGDPLLFDWDLTGGNSFSTAGASTGFTPDDGPAVRTVRARVSDGHSGPVTASREISVENVAPVLEATLSGTPATRLALSAADPSSADQAAGFDFTIDVGADGSAVQHATGQSAEVQLDPPVGTTPVRITATDKDGGVSQAVTLQVTREPVVVTRCVVPRMKGLTLAKAKTRLRRAHCRPGKVRRPKSGRGRLVVRSQSLRPGASRPAGTRVNLALRHRRA